MCWPLRQIYRSKMPATFFFKAESIREEWYHFPTFNHTSDGYASDWRNPVHYNWGRYHTWGRWGSMNFMGLNKSVKPSKLVAPSPLPYETSDQLERLRKLMLPLAAKQSEMLTKSFSQPHTHLHTGDGKILPRLSRETKYSSKSANAEGLSFQGGLYIPDKMHTCGGNALGAPCLDSDNQGGTAHGLWYAFLLFSTRAPPARCHLPLVGPAGTQAPTTLT